MGQGRLGWGLWGGMALKHVHWSGTGTFGVGAVGRVALKHVHWSGTGTFGVGGCGEDGVKTRTLEWDRDVWGWGLWGGWR